MSVWGREKQTDAPPALMVHGFFTVPVQLCVRTVLPPGNPLLESKESWWR